MALINKWWILCAVSLSCVARLGSCRRHREGKMEKNKTTMYVCEDHYFNFPHRVHSHLSSCAAAKGNVLALKLVRKLELSPKFVHIRCLTIVCLGFSLFLFELCM